jgi:hypothetical protein
MHVVAFAMPESLEAVLKTRKYDITAKDKHGKVRLRITSFAL